MIAPTKTMGAPQAATHPATTTAADPTPTARWLAVASVALGVFSFVTTEFLPVGILPQIATDLHAPLAMAGLLLTAPGLVAAFCAPAVLVLAGRLDRRHLLLSLTGLLVLADLIGGLASNFPVMVIGRALFGAGLGGFWTVALATGGRLVPARHRPRALSLILAGITLATIVGLPLGSLIGNRLGWRASFLAATLLAAIAGLGQVFALPSLPARGRVMATDFGNVMRQGPFRAAMVLVLCLFGGNLAAYTYLAAFLQSRSDLGPGAIPIVLLAFGITSFLANAVMPGALARRARLTVGLQTLFMAIALLGLARPGGALPLTLALLILWAIPFGAVPLCLNHWTQRLSSVAPEAGSALYVSTVQIAIALGSAGGAVAVAQLGLPANFALGAVLSMAGGALLIASPDQSLPAVPGS